MGCHFDRQQGSHRIYKRKGLKRPIVVPFRDDVPIFIIQNNLRLLDLSREEYFSILEKL